MKIAVYTCALNEANFVERWFESSEDADYRLVADTGSTDGTVDELRKFQVDTRHLAIKPWRFDDAKNFALFSLPTDVDVAIQLDMDEVLADDWRAKLEAVWTGDTNRLRYLYVWSWLEPGHPDRIYYADKIGGRFSHRWRNAIHEVLQPTGEEHSATCEHVIIEHHPDPNKPRDGYLDLLALSVKEDPLNDRNSHYYARELYFHGQNQEALNEFQRHLSLPTARWSPERAASLRYMGKVNEVLTHTASAYNCYTMATLEDPFSRESYIDLASFLLRQQEWAGVIHFAMKAANIPDNQMSYITERYAREEGPYDLAAVALYNLGQKQAATEFARKALEFNPNDSRLQENLKLMST